ncbi:MAG: methyltransferase domain-containing protein [Patescibacteria group bacterium]|nr:methyltransferase domain-containing protein [Patescibacteria group bacterium]MBU2472864.1 methyltransferase domain-containing protein [Patescibacteria group bacterium]
MSDNFFQRIKKEYHHITNKQWILKDVGRHWDETTDYDDINEKTYSYFRRFVDGYNLCTIPDKSYLLDICSRTGNGSIYFYQKNKVRKVVCADVTEKMQKICSDNLTNYQIDFETKLFSNFPLSIPDNEFDAIISFETLEHIYPPKTFIQELSRVLKPGGELLLTCPNVLWEPIHWLAAIFNIHHSEGPHRFRTRKNILKMLESASLKMEKEKTTILIPGGPKFLIKFGEWFEKKFEKTLMPYLGLRRIFICRKY